MTFSYYARLSARQQAIYRESDRIGEMRVPDPTALMPLVEALQGALAADSRRGVALAVDGLCRTLLEQLRVPRLKVKVLAVRPSRRWGELHGLYTADETRPAEIRVWMRTARHRRVVAFRTFLRTLLHELCHHLDYQALKLGDSFHTEGFFRRESSLFRQLVPAGRSPLATRPGRPGPSRRSTGVPPGPGAAGQGAGRPRAAGPASAGGQRRLPFGSDEND